MLRRAPPRVRAPVCGLGAGEVTSVLEQHAEVGRAYRVTALVRGSVGALRARHVPLFEQARSSSSEGFASSDCSSAAGLSSGEGSAAVDPRRRRSMSQTPPASAASTIRPASTSNTGNELVLGRAAWRVLGCDGFGCIVCRGFGGDTVLRRLGVVGCVLGRDGADTIFSSRKVRGPATPSTCRPWAA